MTKLGGPILLLAALSMSFAVNAADSLRCGSRLVSVGDTKAEVLIKCGSPAWKDNWTNELIDDVNTATERRVSTTMDRWVYNFGSHSFLEFLLFENGSLTSITPGDYGFDPRHGAAKPCDGSEFAVGQNQYEVLQRCGEPFFKDSREEDRVTTVDKRTSKLVKTRIDEWTYNLGPNKFLRILKFENGRLVNVSTGDRGF